MKILNKYIFLWMVCFFCNGVFGQSHKETPASFVQVGNLGVDWHTNADKLFTSGRHPRFSWEVLTGSAATQSIRQVSGYQVIMGSRKAVERLRAAVTPHVTNPENKEVAGISWNSGKVVFGDLFHAYYNGQQPLDPDHIYYWAVRVFDQTGAPGRWSKLDSFQTALFDREDFAGAIWIGQRQMRAGDRILPGDTAVKVKGADGVIKTLPFGTENDTLPLLRKEFRLSGQQEEIDRATLYISGLGQFEARLNGKKVGNHYLDPGWTNYQKEALYVSFDVKSLLEKGQNAIGVSLGNGFYYIAGKKGWYKKLLVQYGYPKMICRLSIHYKNGSVQNVVSDGSWQTANSSILFSSIYGGELEDGRLINDNWDKKNFGAVQGGWQNAVAVSDTPLNLNMQNTDPVKVMEKFKARSVYPVFTEQNKPVVKGWTFDMGQNCSGIPYIEVNGKKGDTITLIPGELMGDNHAANQNATGKYRLVYILGKDGWQRWHPKFTYYGFRYIELRGAVSKGKDNPDHLPVIEDIQTWHIRNSAPEVGSFGCSNELFNQTCELIKWAMKSNMVSLLTDCPHREKLGWLEQVHLMGSSLRYNFGILPLLKKALTDMRNSQTASGLIPEIAPEFTVFTWGGDMFRDSPEWGSSAIIVPWYIYEWYGDSTELLKNYAMMARYINYLKGKANGHILYQGLGDWYDLGPNPPGTSQLTPKGLTATAIYYYDLQILAKTAKLLGYQKDIEDYLDEAAKVRKAFNQLFLHIQKSAAGSLVASYGSGSQTADAMALYMELVPDSLHKAVVKHLVDGIRKGGYKLTAGDIGYRYLLRVLEKEGYSEVIYKMNNRSDVPGYGYQLARGATALTESWQALPSVSNNHFMLGHIMEWFYSGLLGIRLDLAGDAQKVGPPLVIAPQMVGELHWAKGNYHSPYGLIEVEWHKSEDRIELKLTVPVGLEAELRLPYQKGSTMPGIKPYAVKIKKLDNHMCFVTNAISGTHVYTIKLK